jgi:hypothetical protein
MPVLISCHQINTTWTDNHFSRNRLSHRYINIATTRYNCHTVQLLGHQHKHAQKKTQKKERRKKVDKVGSAKTKTPSSCRALRRILTAYQATPPRRGATTTTLLPGLSLGFPSVRAGTREEGFTHPPFRKARWRPQASPRRCRSGQKFLPTLATLPRTLHRAPPNTSPTNLRHHGHTDTTAILPRPTNQGQQDQGGSRNRGMARYWTRRREH